MEITVYPRSFGIQAAKIPTPQGGEMDVVRVNIQDAGSVMATPAGPIQVPGPVVTVIFGMDDWNLFREAIGDPEGSQKRQEARSRIQLATGLSSTLKQKPSGRPWSPWVRDKLWRLAVVAGLYGLCLVAFQWPA